VALSEWSPELQTRFFGCYRRAFADRPGFRDWAYTLEQWVDWVSDDPVPQWTLLATRDGEDVGFAAGASDGDQDGWITQVGVDGDQDGWITQVGVVPATRGTGLDTGLTRRGIASDACRRPAGCTARRQREQPRRHPGLHPARLHPRRPAGPIRAVTLSTVA
jgi:ribosomal protein S18 acetylase RimI-like enzyme